MSYGYRYFLFEKDGTMRHVAQRVALGLAWGSDRMPQYAGQKLRYVSVTLELEDGRPTKIVRIEAGFWDFDESGRADHALKVGAIQALETHDALQRALRSKPSGPVVSINAKLARAKWEREHRWQPDPGTITRVTQAIWPETAGRSVKRPAMAVGVRKRRVPMTYDAKEAHRKCEKAMWRIPHEIQMLKLPSLKALIQKIEDEPGPDPVSREIWYGVRRAAEKRLEIVKARKSKKGVWFVVVSYTRWSDEARTGFPQGGVLEEVRCNGRDAAEKKAQELMKEYADKYSVFVTFDFDIYSEVEYIPELEASHPSD